MGTKIIDERETEKNKDRKKNQGGTEAIVEG